MQNIPNMSERMDGSFFDVTTASCISKAIGVTLYDCNRIEQETNRQRLCSAWFKERSKQLISFCKNSISAVLVDLAQIVPKTVTHSKKVRKFVWK